MKHILLTNDDGFDSSGLLALKEALCDLAHIMVVAPAHEKSACAHGLTLTRPLHFVQIDDDFYKLEDGTPSDCVYLALNALYKEGYKPDLVISGINLGSNMGEDVTYSGTAAGAMEACIQGIPSIAISQLMNDVNRTKHFDFALAKSCIADIVKNIFQKGFPLEERKFLNINIPHIPPQDCKGYKITQMGYRIYSNQAHIHRNPRGQEYYWLGLHPLQWQERSDTSYSNGSDFQAVHEKYISITPIKLDMTSYEDSSKLSQWICP
ncbi:5'/3'-nucleotidase SurE [Helicobacter marmotae]|uniref:5'-nucleotidase SurE n=1 Tax=Helicobacter marmotae TaxID=152490 RepID=A0A3D8I162_9HELI|nr:5'/3'-nucleotidase SurE [Helicobacter marmotae]RDU58862.1 5'/3'-nucleotidase SurE [Helicobacter marmotae]